MLTRTLALLLAAAPLSNVFADDVSRHRAIDLNAPGAIEELWATNPKHYKKIRRILVGLEQEQYRNVPEWIRTTVGARDVSYPPIWLVSFPPQRFLSFTLDRTHYSARVTLDFHGAEIYPVGSAVIGDRAVEHAMTRGANPLR